MDYGELLMMAFYVLGGLSVFIYGMKLMTRSLTTAAGASLRKILTGATKSPVHGVVFGVIVGFLAHSAAATTMLAGFINAGVMTLGQALAPVFGCNLGTSLSSQLMSFNISQYCWIPIGLGFLLKSFIPSKRWDKVGDAFFGFGLLFLGMLTIKQGIMDHGGRELLTPILAHIKGDTWTQRTVGVLLGVVLTAILTSSGAMVGLCFALIHAQVFTSFDQVGPIILGACIGTCIVPVMASLPMRITAKRAAWAHVLFNVLNVIIALCVWNWLKPLCIWAAPDVPADAALEAQLAVLPRQLANLHTFAMTIAVFVILPFSKWFTALLLKLTPSKEPDPEPSFLEDDLLQKPEQALAAAIRELRRMADLCVDSMKINGRMILEPTRQLARRLDSNEEILNEVRRTMVDYLERLARNHLSRRQTMFLQHVDRCMKDIERIGDHLAHIGDISVARWKQDDAMLPEDLFKTWFALFCTAKKVVRLMAKSFDPDQASFQDTAMAILRARDAYTIQSMDAKAEFVGAARERKMTPVGAYYLSRYIEDLDRLVRRAKSIALAERQPDFWVKQARLDRIATPEEPFVAPPRVDASKYLPMLDNDKDDDPGAIETFRVPKQSPHVVPDENASAPHDDAQG